MIKHPYCGRCGAFWTQCLCEEGSSLQQAGSAHSWVEDFGGENGQYQNKCIDCGTLFLGHKRRLVCKVCDTKAREKWEAMTEEERQESIARTRDAIATFYAQNALVSDREPKTL